MPWVVNFRNAVEVWELYKLPQITTLQLVVNDASRYEATSVITYVIESLHWLPVSAEDLFQSVDVLDG